MTIRKDKLRRGLQQIRDLVDGTHWIKSSYVSVEYLEGDGEYEDGAVVLDSKVVGCLVGLSRLVAAKKPTYVKGKQIEISADLYPPRQDEFAAALESAMAQTILEEFVDGGYMDEEYEPSEISIEGWNDQNVRTKEQVLAMLDATLARYAPAGR